MITIRKLKTLKPSTLRRKIAVLLQSFEQQLLDGGTIDMNYLRQLLELTEQSFSDSKKIKAKAETAEEGSLRTLNSLRHEILKELGTEPADWDMSVSHNSVTDSVLTAPKSDIKIFLDDIRSPFNIGSIFRTSEAFGVSKIFLSPDCPSPEHQRARRTSMGCTETIDWEVADHSVLDGGLPVFALELGGTSVSEFDFPEKGIAVIGSEELGISPASRAAVSSSLGIVSIPIFGHKASVNVSVAFGIMMHRWAEALYFMVG